MLFLKKQKILFTLLLLAMVFLFLVNISLGSVSIPLKEVVKGTFGQEMTKESWEIILWNFRFPKAITAILVGIGLSMSGLLMQTLFRNPLAGPYVLGLSSGASLGVAFVILGTGLLPTYIASFFLSTSACAFLNSSIRFNSSSASSNPICVYTFIVTDISECPMRYCNVLGFIPDFAILEQ